MIDWKDYLEKKIETIVEDKIHGADWLSNAALELLGETARIVPVENRKELLAILKETARKIIDSRPSITAIANKLSKLIFEIQKETTSVQRLKNHTIKKASVLIDNSKNDKIKAVAKAVELLKGFESVITYSYSSTVFQTLSAIPDLKVIVPEARPLFEGRSLAMELAEKGLKVTLIVDAAMAFYIKDVDAAVVGADSVLYDGSIVNKIGTKLLALATADVDLPFYVVCETSKFNLLNYLGKPIILEEKDPSELAENIEGLNVKNPYFEITPAYLINGIVTEMGLMDSNKLESVIDSMSEYIRSLY